MDDQSDSPRKPHPDPEVEALLHFPPVVRKCIRHDGWLPERQVEFIVALTVLGRVEQSAIAVGGTMSGVYKLRTAAGGEGFAAAWDGALALHLRRYPRPEPKGRPSRGEIQSGAGRKPWPAAAARPAPDPLDPDEEARLKEEMLTEMLDLYELKLKEERTLRLEGRIVGADFAVRQLSWLEVVFDLGGKARQVLDILKRGDHGPLDIVATPMSELLGEIRRETWLEKGEADRPPPPPLGRHDHLAAFGEPHWYDSARDGDPREWELRRKENERLAAQAQRAWEEKAKKEAEAWARREAANDGEAERSTEGKADDA
jgi:hypothetical protein